MTRITDAWLTRPESQLVCAILTDAGYQAYFVGGCVRNALLRAPISDLDLATDARPEKVMKLADQAGFHAVPTGIDHGTVTVVVNGHPYEVTTFRKDIDTDGRRAVVAFAGTVNEDAHRRDFTMNALFATPEGQVVDPLGGLADLKARRVRFIDDPAARIREDYLRILRFFRFHAWYGDPGNGLNPDGLAAIAANLDGLETLSRERIGGEMKKLLAAPDPAPAVAAMAASGVLARVLPGASDRALAPLVHLEGETGTRPEPIRRLACLGASDLKERFRLSRDDDRRLNLLHDRIGDLAGPGELGYRHGVDTARDVLLLRAAVTGTGLPEGWQARVETGANAEFGVTARDLMPGLSGPALGARLAALEEKWIASGFTLTRRELLK